MLKTVKWILQQPFGETLSASLTTDLKTPCDYIEDKLDYQRRVKRAAIPRARDSPGTFAEREGHPANALEVLMLIKGLSDPSPDKLLKLRYGCTCDQCLLGILSPRVAFALLFQAEIAHDMLREELDLDDRTWVELNDDRLEFLPPTVP
jgi:hypothetical protein